MKVERNEEMERNGRTKYDSRINGTKKKVKIYGRKIDGTMSIKMEKRKKDKKL